MDFYSMRSFCVTPSLVLSPWEERLRVRLGSLNDIF
jgi:hypothetical protein